MDENRNQIRFPGSLGGQLAARLDTPPGQPIAYALFAHCFTCSKDTLAASRVSAALTARGIAVLRFDFTGLGGSEGDFANTNFSSNVGDLVAAAGWLRQHHAAPRILIGHSLGGAAVLAAAREVPEAKAVVTVGAPYQPADVKRLLAAAVPDIESAGEARVELAGRRFTVRKRFLDDIGTRNNQDAIGNLRKALLIFHSARDTIVSIDNAAQIFMAAKHPKSFVSLDDADHLLTRREDAEYVAAVLAAWVSRYLDAPRMEAASIASDDPGVVMVAGVRGAKFAQEISVGRHRLRADEPTGAGGTDTGLSPYDFLLAGLGACTSMTLRLYADLKQIPLDGVTVRLKHAKVHAQDCAECETKDGKIDRIDRVIELAGQLDEAQRAKLLEIANKCPVHRTLTSEIWIPTRLA